MAVVNPKLNEAAARGLDTITRAVLTAGFEAVKLTYQSESWRELGFASFEAWAGSMPKYQLPRDERRQMVTELDGLGMTQRQIAAAVGVGAATVNRDLHVSDETPEPDDRVRTKGDDVRNETPAPVAPPRITPAPKPELGKAAKALPDTERGWRSVVDQVLSMMAMLDPEEAEPITTTKVEEARRVLRRMEELRVAWLPFMEQGLKEVHRG